MKKTFFFFMLTIFLVKVGFAQEGFKLGLKVNPIISFAAITDSSKTKIDGLKSKPRVGYAFGLMINYGFTNTIGFHTGIHVLQKGFSGTERMIDTLNGVHSKKFKQVFNAVVEIPLALKLRSPEIGTGIFITGLFGVVPELNLSSRYNTQTLAVAEQDSATGAALAFEMIDVPQTRNPDRINIFTLSFLVGAGADLEFDWGTIALGASFHWGLMDVLRRKHESIQKRHVKMSYVALDIGYYF